MTVGSEPDTATENEDLPPAVEEIFASSSAGRPIKEETSSSSDIAADDDVDNKAALKIPSADGNCMKSVFVITSLFDF